MSTKLTTRDYEILQHLLRYKVASREMFHRALFTKVSLNAVTKVVTRLVANGWLNRHPFLVASCYFTLSDKAARLFGMPEAAIERPMPSRELIAEYAMGAYCCLGEKPRKRLTRDEIEQEYEHLYFADLDVEHYYLDANFRPELLGTVAIDEGSAPLPLLESSRQNIAARSKRASFRKMVQGGGFRLSVLTAVPEKAAIFKAGLKKIDWPEGLRTEVVVVPGLMNAVANLASAGSESPNGASRHRTATPNGHDSKFAQRGVRTAVARR
jgi:hypothetical protein